MHPNTYLALNKRGIWEIRWTGRDDQGRPRSNKISTGETEERSAEAYRAQWLKARDEAAAALSTPTVADILDGYLEDCAERGVRRSQWHVLAPVRKALGAYRAADLSGQPLRDYKRSRSLVVTPATVVRELGSLTAALNWAAHPEKGRMIEKRDVPMILLPAVPRRERGFLNEDQEELFHDLALNWHWKRVGIYVALGLGTGARKEAIEQLNWDRVDMGAGLIDYRVPGERLTKKQRVPVPINRRLRAVLERVPANERFGRVVGDGNVRGGYDRFRASTPFPWVSSHIMRHTFITLNLRAGVSVFDVAQAVGDTPEIISKHYGHHQADWRLHEAMNKRFA